ncbi:MAG: hypothetical protein M3Y56_03025 [Armatimonadota bacterium]|nr:hypothetical protein [Armatimonadota bacterium]
MSAAELRTNTGFPHVGSPSLRAYVFLIGLYLTLCMPCAVAATSMLKIPAALTSGQSRFITSLAYDGANEVWVGTEGGGVWNYQVDHDLWTYYSQFGEPAQEFGLWAPGEQDAYAVACDHGGRTWIGTHVHGVCVWNGNGWRSYGVGSGPLGSHVYAIAISPLDGDVWMGTELGLSRYNIKAASWHYYLQGDGLASNDIRCLAFSQSGVLYVGTACSGVSVARPGDHYRSWRTVAGPLSAPTAAFGAGLPGSEINALLVATDGTVYVGTNNGLGSSADGGHVWRFRRGEDWKARVEGLAVPVRLPAGAQNEPLLLEDWITCIAQDSAGRIFVGHRTRGYEVIDGKTGRRSFPSPGQKPESGYVTAIVPLPGQQALIGQYGEGLEYAATPYEEGLKSSGSVTDPPDDYVAPSSSPPKEIPFPARAVAPDVTALKALTRQLQASLVVKEKPVAAYLGEDRSTGGDWVGHYGRQYALLFAAGNPVDQDIRWDPVRYSIDAQIGAHSPAGDSLRLWFAGYQPMDQYRFIYSPVAGQRVDSSCDDHGEMLPMSYQGPGIWFNVKVPEGVHQLSFYFLNSDGHKDTNRYRDYIVELRPFFERPEQAQGIPTLARARVSDFYDGVWEKFLVVGPARYSVKVDRNGSFNTICTAAFIDKLQGPVTAEEKLPLPFMKQVSYSAPNPSRNYPGAPSNSPPAPANVSDAANDLWKTLDDAYKQPQSAPLQRVYRLYAYRAVLDTGQSWGRLQNWNWFLHIWTARDRQLFDGVMTLAHTMPRPALRSLPSIPKQWHLTPGRKSTPAIVPVNPPAKG